MEYDDSKTVSVEGECREGEELIHTAREHLELALEGDDQPTTRYHIRAALQSLVIESERESD